VLTEKYMKNEDITFKFSKEHYSRTQAHSREACVYNTPCGRSRKCKSSKVQTITLHKLKTTSHMNLTVRKQNQSMKQAELWNFLQLRYETFQSQGRLCCQEIVTHIRLSVSRKSHSSFEIAKEPINT
jgi:hypothetical protein